MIKGINKYRELAENLQGIYTIKTLSERLKVDRAKAIYIIYRLRKLGCIKTSYGNGKRRIYSISFRNKQKGISYTEKINEVSPLQLASSNPHYIHGRDIKYEEAIIYAIKQRDIRYLIGSIALFRKVKDWSLLYHLAKKENLVREVAALYELSRRFVRKVRRMPKRFLNLARKERHPTFIINKYSSDDFKDLEKKWKVYIPLNASDLEDYKR